MAERLVQVQSAALEGLATARDRRGPVGRGLRLLGHQVDRPARGPAAGERGRGSLGHLDLLDVVGIARVAAEVAHAVDEEVGAGAEPADAQVVAGPRPSPACMVMPGTLRSTSRSEIAFCSWMTEAGITVTVCGTSRKGPGCFGEESARA